MPSCGATCLHTTSLAGAAVERTLRRRGGPNPPPNVGQGRLECPAHPPLRGIVGDNPHTPGEGLRPSELPEGSLGHQVASRLCWRAACLRGARRRRRPRGGASPRSSRAARPGCPRRLRGRPSGLRRDRRVGARRGGGIPRARWRRAGQRGGSKAPAPCPRRGPTTGRRRRVAPGRARTSWPPPRAGVGRRTA